jgi:hypothetical protein
MSHIAEHVLIDAPPAQAASRIRHFLRERGNSDGDTAKLHLHLRLNDASSAVPMSLERTIIATFQPLRRAGDMSPRYGVQWAPEVAGPFPLFSGELFVQGTDDYASFSLCLDGAYAPPLGIVGGAFDQVVGKRIARATLRDLLEQMRESIELAYRNDESKKGGASIAPAESTR